MAELRGEPIKRELDPEITVDVPAFLPDDYLPDTGQRLDFYRRLAQLHHGNSSLREGRTYTFDHDTEDALVWLRAHGGSHRLRRDDSALTT